MSHTSFPQFPKLVQRFWTHSQPPERVASMVAPEMQIACVFLYNIFSFLCFCPFLFIYAQNIFRFTLLILFLFFYSFTHMYIHCLEHFSHLPLSCITPPLPLPSRQKLFCPFLQFCWREDISNNKKDKAIFASWDKDSYTEKFLALLPCTSVLQPELIHLNPTSSLLPSHLPKLTFIILRLLYLLLCSADIKHVQVLGFLPIPIPHICAVPLECDPCPKTLLHLP
jgi:hypothetical protein